jgi:hypothetical protein
MSFYLKDLPFFRRLAGVVGPSRDLPKQASEKLLFGVAQRVGFMRLISSFLEKYANDELHYTKFLSDAGCAHLRGASSKRCWYSS